MQQVEWQRFTHPGVHYLAVVGGRALRVSRHLSGNGWRWQHRPFAAAMILNPWQSEATAQTQWPDVGQAQHAALEFVAEGWGE